MGKQLREALHRVREQQAERNQSLAILRLPAVMARTGLSRSTIYLRIKEGKFPAPISLGIRAVGWVESAVDNWLAERIEQSRNEAA